MLTIAFFPQTGSVRLFQSYNLAQEWFPSHYLITRPHEFHDHPVPGNTPKFTAEECYQSMAARHSDKVPYGFRDLHIDPGEACFALAEIVGERVNTAPYAAYARLDDAPTSVLKRGFNIDLVKAKAAMEAKIPKQARVLARVLYEAQHDFYTKDEMQKFVGSPAVWTKLNTKQDPWRIFRYYRNHLVQHGAIVDTSEAAE